MNSTNAFAITDSNEVRTYGAFTYPVDPSIIFTMTDMDLAFALTTSIVVWSDDKQISGGSAESWEILNDGKVIRFTLRKGLKWSNGETIDCKAVVDSLRDAKIRHPEDVRSFVSLAKRIECLDDRKFEIEIEPSATPLQLLRKLTDCQLGLFRSTAGGRTVDTSVSAGAFILRTASPTEVVLEANPFWYRANSSIAKRVILRSMAGKAIEHHTLLKVQCRFI